MSELNAWLWPLEHGAVLILRSYSGGKETTPKIEVVWATFHLQGALVLS